MCLLGLARDIVTIRVVLLLQTERLTRVAVAHSWGWTIFVVGIHGVERRGSETESNVLNDVERRSGECVVWTKNVALDASPSRLVRPLVVSKSRRRLRGRGCTRLASKACDS